MLSEPKKKVWAVGGVEPMGNDPKAFPEADYLANTERKSRSIRTWCLAILAIVVVTVLGLLAIYGVAARLDFLRHR